LEFFKKGYISNVDVKNIKLLINDSAKYSIVDDGMCRKSDERIGKMKNWSHKPDEKFQGNSLSLILKSRK
jgi:hypothetical protein